jgi:hypothetical protein
VAVVHVQKDDEHDDHHPLLFDAVKKMEESMDPTDVNLNSMKILFVAVNVKVHLVPVSPKF